MKKLPKPKIFDIVFERFSTLYPNNLIFKIDFVIVLGYIRKKEL